MEVSYWYSENLWGKHRGMSSLHLVFRLLLRTQKFLSRAAAMSNPAGCVIIAMEPSTKSTAEMSEELSAWIRLVPLGGSCKSHVYAVYVCRLWDEDPRCHTELCAQNPHCLRIVSRQTKRCMNFVQARSRFHSSSAAWPASSSPREVPCQMGSSSCHENVAMGSVMCPGENTLQTTQASEFCKTVYFHYSVIGTQKMLFDSASIACVWGFCLVQTLHLDARWCKPIQMPFKCHSNAIQHDSNITQTSPDSFQLLSSLKLCPLFCFLVTLKPGEVDMKDHEDWTAWSSSSLEVSSGSKCYME